MPDFRCSASRLALIVGLAAGLAISGPASALTLEEALVLTYESNPDLLSTRAALRAQDEEVAQAQGLWRPSITSSLSVGATQVNAESNGVTTTDDSSIPRTGSLTISQSLYSGGVNDATIAGAIADTEATRASLLNTEQTVLLAAVTAYVNVLREEAILRLQISNLQRLEKQLQATRDRFRVGEVTRTDVAQAESRVARAQGDRTSAEGALVSARVTFERVVGVVPDTVDKPGTPAGLPTSRDEAVQIAVRENLSLVSAKFSEESARHGIDESFGGLLPTLDLVGQAQQTYDTSGGNNESTSLTAEVQLSIPIYQQGIQYSEVRQAKEIANQARLEVDVARRDAVEAAATAYEDYQTALAEISSREAEVDSASIALEGVQQEATVGARTVLDVLDAEQELLDSQVALVQAERDAIVQSYQLLQAMGRLTARDLGLPVVVYDFDRHYRDIDGKWWGTTPSGSLPGN